MTASQLRDAALYILRCADIPSARRGSLLINTGFDSDSPAGRCWLRVESDSRIVFRAWWEPAAPDELAAVVNHGPWESELVEAARYGR